jgi:hypothetical protein
VTDSREGVLIPAAPVGSDDEVEIQFQLIDESSLLTSGNGDGELAPGEAFQLMVTLTNWSSVTLATATTTLRPLTPLVSFRKEELNSARRDPPMGRIPLYPGVTGQVVSPVLRVSEAASAGDTLSFRITFDGSQDITDTLSFVTRGTYPSYEATLSIDGVDT